MKYSLDKKIYIINILALIFLTLPILYLLTENLISQKKDIIKTTKNQTESVAKFILSDIDKLIHGIEELSEGIHIIEETHGDKKYEEEALLHNTYIDRLLNNNKRPYIRSILILNDKLQISHDNTGFHENNHHNKEHINRKNNSFLKQYFENKNFVKLYKETLVEKEIFISKPFDYGIKGKRSFTISKVYLKNKEIKHIVFVIINLDYITNKYTTYLDSPDSTIFFTTKEGEIYTRLPFKKIFLEYRIPEIEVFSKENKMIKHFEMLSPLDHRFRIATIVKSEYYPIVTGSSVLATNSLKTWQVQKKNTFIISILLLVGLIIIVYYYRKLQNKLINLSQIDALTQLYNRGYFIKQATQAFKRTKRYEENIVVIMIDIDDFKKINDKYGHQIGDKVIQKLSRCIQAGIRDIDIAGRYGGEEFVILLENIDIDNAKIVAQRIKENFEENPLKNSYKTTASFGISKLNEKDTNLEMLINRADEALYISKNNGKNCITIR